MLKVDNIIPLWRVIISNIVSESYPKLSHDNRILKYRTKGALCSRAPKKGVERVSPTLANLGNDHTIVESRVHLTWYQSHALNLVVLINW